VTDRAGSVLELLAGWLPRQRWYAGKGGGDPELARLGGLRLRDLGGAGSGHAEVDVWFVQATTPDGVGVTYQVPLTVRTAPAPDLEHAFVGAFRDEDGERYVYDGPHDHAYLRALLRLLAEEGEAWAGEGAAFGRARAVRPPGGWANDLGSPTRVLSGEQSNTSVIVDAEGERPVILKVFRVLAGGDNPDVVVQTALAAAGSTRVARPAGWVEGWWPVPGGKTPEHGHLVYGCEFLPGSRDAWREATEAVAEGRSFAEQARGLGAATAEVHLTLARALPTSPSTAPRSTPSPTAPGPGRLGRGRRPRAGAVHRRGPHRGGRRPARRAGSGPAAGARRLPPRAGAALGEPGWILLDFEGEPLRPLSERTAPDLALRDVAGMLRSFDYAARHSTVGLDPRTGARGRSGVGGRLPGGLPRRVRRGRRGRERAEDPRNFGVLLRALELDKALYEVVYEDEEPARPGSGSRSAPSAGSLSPTRTHTGVLRVCVHRKPPPRLPVGRRRARGGRQSIAKVGPVTTRGCSPPAQERRSFPAPSAAARVAAAGTRRAPSGRPAGSRAR
jgi:predicted trehalose synthase